MKDDGTEDWFLVVSFKTELLSEYACEKGLRHIPQILGRRFAFKKRKIVDNDIYGSAAEYESFKRIVSEHYKKSFPLIFGRIENANNRLISFAERLPRKERLNSISNAELNKIFSEYYDLYERCAGLIGIPAALEMALNDILKEKLKTELRYDDHITRFLSAVSVSEKPSSVYEEKKDLLMLAIKIKKSKKAQYCLDSRIKRHEQEYAWFGQTLFLGEPYDHDKIACSLKEALAGDPNAELRELRDHMMAERTACRNAQKKTSEELKKDVRLLQGLIHLRNHRLEQMNKGCYLGREIIKEIAKRINLSYDEIIYLMPEEINDALLCDAKISKAGLKSRINRYALITEDGDTKLYLGDEIDSLKEPDENASKTEIRGFSASKGKAIGPARIILDRSELHKVVKGDVLVTRLTTPDFVKAMELSAAIVTDIGGLTSHAAIVARELRKSCITGTKNATKILKTGNIVEVDADNGIVRKLR